MNDKLNFTLRGRYISEKDTVETNPVRKVDSFLTFDATVVYRGFGVEGLGLSLKVNNLLDEDYFHPGIRDARSGNRQACMTTTAIGRVQAVGAIHYCRNRGALSLWRCI